jgi:hypothetical protein
MFAVMKGRRLPGWLVAQPTVLLCCAGWLVVVVITLPQQLVQDSWLTLVSGREVAQHGLPAVDQLTVWTQGATWVDQQWLAQLVFYGLFLLGGLRAVMLLHTALLAATLLVALVAARRLGASQASIGLSCVACIGIAPWALQMRAQTFSELLFVVVLWLLAADSRSPSRRVLFVLPLLVLWANMHGAVVFAASLVVLRGCTFFVDQIRRPSGARVLGWVPRVIALVFGPLLCLFASPYGLSLGGYYRSLLGNPVLREFVDEWGPSTPSPKTGLFYAVAFVTIWLLGRYRGRLTGFEQMTLILTLVVGVSAVRSIVWFGLAGLILIPQLADGALARLEFRSFQRVPATLLVALSLLVALATTAFAATRPSAWYTSAWPKERATRIASLAACNHSTRIFADDRYADWLLWSAPQLRGRVAYDVRFELFQPGQFLDLFKYRNQTGDDWRDAANGYDLIAFDRGLGEPVLKGMIDDGFKQIYQDAALVLLARPDGLRKGEARQTSAGCGSTPAITKVAAREVG